MERKDEPTGAGSGAGERERTRKIIKALKSKPLRDGKQLDLVEYIDEKMKKR